MIDLTNKHLIYMNIGRRFWKADLHDIECLSNAKINQYIKSFRTMISEGIGLYVWGPNGTGKTHVSAALLKHAWHEWRVTGYCVTTAELKESWIEERPAHPGSDEMMSIRASESRILVLDDAGREHRAASGFAESKLGTLLRDRSRQLLTTIITCNLDPTQFGKIYGSSVVELIKECIYPVKLSGKNFRASKAMMLRKDLEGA